MSHFLYPPHPLLCAPGQNWKALSEAEKAKYKAGLTPLPTSGRGGMQAWAPTSSPCLVPAPTTTSVPGRVHPPLPATPAPPPTRAAPSAAPTAPPIALPPLPSDLAQMFEEPIGLGAAPAAPPVPLMAPTASSSNWPERLHSSLPRSPTAAVAVPVAKPVGFGYHWATALADQLGGQLKVKRDISSSTTSATSSANSCHPSCSSDDSEPEPGNTATHAPQSTRSARFGAPAAPSVAQLAAPTPLPADLARMFDDSIGVGTAPAASPAPLVAPTVSSNSWLEQQQLAEALEEQLTGAEAIEVSETVLR